MKTKITTALKRFSLLAFVIINVSAMMKVNAQNARTPLLSQGNQVTNYQGSFINSIEIYPCPTHGLITMQGMVTAQSNIDMRLTDILGRTLIERTETVTPGLYQHNFDLSSYANGLYLLEIRSGSQVVTTRLLKN